MDLLVILIAAEFWTKVSGRPKLETVTVRFEAGDSMTAAQTRVWPTSMETIGPEPPPAVYATREPTPAPPPAPPAYDAMVDGAAIAVAVVYGEELVVSACVLVLCEVPVWGMLRCFELCGWCL